MSTTVNLNNILNDVTTGLTMLNAAEPDIASIIALFTGTQETVQQMLTDANTTELADEAKIKTELGS